MVVEDMCNVVDIESACSHIGCYKDVDTAAFKGSDGYFTLFLLHISMQTADFEALCGKVCNQSVNLFFHTAEDNTLVRVFVVNESDQCIVSFTFLYDIVVLGDFGVGAFRLGNGNCFGIFKDLFGKSSDGFWHGCGEHQCLTLFWQEGEDVFDLIEKAHIEHLIRFIQYDKFGVELDLSAHEKVLKTSRRGNNDGSLFDTLDLFAVSGTSIDGGGFKS